MRGEDELWDAGKAAAAGGAYREFTGDGAAELRAAAARQARVEPSGGVKDAAADTVAEHPWHTGPWESVKAALGGANGLVVVGSLAAAVVLAVGAVAVFVGGDSGDSDSALETDGSDGDLTPGGGDKFGDEDEDDEASTGSTSPDSTTSTTVSSSSTVSTTTTLDTTPGGPGPDPTVPGDDPGPDPTNPPPTSPSTTTRPATTTTRPTAPAPAINRFTATTGLKCRTPAGTSSVTFRWAASNGSSALLSDGVEHKITKKPTDAHTICTHIGHTWTLTVSGAAGTPPAVRTVTVPAELIPGT